jgi:hypothetical protein
MRFAMMGTQLETSTMMAASIVSRDQTGLALEALLLLLTYVLPFVETRRMGRKFAMMGTLTMEMAVLLRALLSRVLLVPLIQHRFAFLSVEMVRSSPVRYVMMQMPRRLLTMMVV